VTDDVKGWNAKLLQRSVNLIALLPLNFKLSSGAKAELGNLGFDSQYIAYIERICNYAIWCQGAVSNNPRPRELKAELEKFVAALDQALDVAYNDVGIHTYDCMALAAKFSSKEEFHQFAAGLETTELLEPFESTLTSVEELRDLANATLDQIDLKRGPARAVTEEEIARWLAIAMTSMKVRPTKYIDGPYFRTLEILFREALPDSRSDTYRNYGKKALDELQEGVQMIFDDIYRQD
jgi:hypothetical protein